MKSLILFAAIILTSAVSFGGDVSNRNVQTAFDREFAGAGNVSWYETGNSFMAKFTLNAHKITAHFDKNGNLLATLRNISDAELPMQVITKLMRRYPGQNIHSAVEYTVGNLTHYSIILESGTKWTNLRSDAAGNLSMITKFNKS